MTLHLVYSPESLTVCIARSQEADAILLLGDGVLVMSTIDSREHAQSQGLGCKVYALAEDVLARGLKEIAEQHPHIEALDYAGFVELAAIHQPIVSWHD